MRDRKAQSYKGTKLQSKKETGYRRLILWQKGRRFISLLYKKTDKFPPSEKYGLQSQIRRAALSFLLNIVEGQRRNLQKNF